MQQYQEIQDLVISFISLVKKQVKDPTYGVTCNMLWTPALFYHLINQHSWAAIICLRGLNFHTITFINPGTDPMILKARGPPSWLADRQID